MFGIDWFGIKRRKQEEADRIQRELEAERAERLRMWELDLKFKLTFICPKCCWWGRKLDNDCGAPWWIACDMKGRQSKCD